MAKSKKSLIGISKIYKDKVIERLKHAYAHDYLEEDDFEKRLEIATHTKDRQELDAMVADLPEQQQEQKKQAFQGSLNKGEINPKGTIFSILGGVTRKGQWRPPRHLKVIATLGGIELDFTEAKMAPGVTEINIFCMLGGVDIRVPPGINVDASCVAILGGVEDKSRETEYIDGPTLKIRGFVLLGGVDIKPPKKKLLQKILKKFGLE